jgi:hypothetical protein
MACKALKKPGKFPLPGLPVNQFTQASSLQATNFDAVSKVIDYFHVSLNAAIAAFATAHRRRSARPRSQRLWRQETTGARRKAIAHP